MPGRRPGQAVSCRCCPGGGWQASGATEAMHGNLREQCRIAAGREPRPTAAVIDSQSVTGSEMVARATRGWDQAKKVNGRYLEP